MTIFMVRAQSPHGDSFVLDCIICHSPESWKLDRKVYSFNHDSTSFQLEGQHVEIDCKSCHQSLVFPEAPNECSVCHLDIHSQTAGTNCVRCHNANSWLVEDITQLHELNGFPLMGAHATANCNDCHQSESLLRFDPIGHECINCHRDEYLATTNPDHVKAGYDTDCQQCHQLNAFQWNASGINHDFFPLTQGHEINDCAKCHQGDNYSDISSECAACHQQDFAAANNPNHLSLDFSIDCKSCHNTSPDWRPATFREHDDLYFPIFSGEHAVAWSECMECHLQPENYQSFTCTSCHEHNQREMDEEHAGINGYSYQSTACLACHPTGDSDSKFDHNRTNFPLTGAHIQTECLQCHANGYSGTPTLCSECHIAEFQQTINPNHQQLGLSDDCASCHSTEPAWKPASFPNHNEFRALNGAHAAIANDCAACHMGDYNNTPGTCAECHISDYNSTNNPPHQASGFNDDCAACHSETAWQPTTFDHDGQYFPIYSGAHNGAWNQCTECHTTQNNFTAFSCTECHEHNRTKTDQEHSGISGYAFNSDACLVCHPTGSADGAFDHNTTSFPLTGAHTATDCAACHINGYAGTSSYCADCHQADFNQASDPNHTELGLSDDCASCHSTQPGWSPASFDVHDQYYRLNGAHAAIATDCAACHQAGYDNTPNTCAGCHINDYNSTNDPPHQASGFSTDCASCHTENAWRPATFDHDGQYFPIYSGKHRGEWNQCTDCHTNAGNYAIFSCIDCHEHSNRNEVDRDHSEVRDYQYNSNACYECHPTGDD